MSRSAVFAEQIPAPEVAAALREHREDREALLDSLTGWLLANPHVRAAWLWGSFSRGEADDLSDLDLWMLVTDEAAALMGDQLCAYTSQTGSFITGGESPQNGPPGGGFFSSLHEGRHGLLHLDGYWQPVSTVSDVPSRAVIFNRLGETPSAAPSEPLVILQEPDALTDEEERIVGGVRFAWTMLSIAAKTLARHPASDMSLMIYPRSGLEEAAALLDLGELFGASDWLVPESENALNKVNRLRSLTNKTARLTEAANARGLGLSIRANACLLRYLSMVAEIVPH